MSLSNLTSKPEITSRGAEVLPSSFGDIYDAAYRQAKLNFNSDSSIMGIGAARDERNRLYEEAMGTSVNKLRDTPEYKARTIAPSERFYGRDLDKEISRLMKDPEMRMLLKDVPIGDQLEALAGKMANKSSEEMREAQYYNSSNWAGTAEFLGGGASGVTDPVNLLTLPLGVGAGSTVAKTIAVEAAISLGTDLLIQPLVIDWQKETGQEYGFETAATNALATAAFSGLLAGGIKLTGDAVYGIGATGRELRDAIEEAEGLPPSVKPTKKLAPEVVSDSLGQNIDVSTNYIAGLSHLANHDALPSGIKADIRVEVAKVKGKKDVPTEYPSVKDIKAHSSNVDITVNGINNRSINNLDLEPIAETRFAVTDAAYAPPELRVDTKEAILPAVQKANQDAASKTLSRTERLNLEQQKYELEDEIFELEKELDSFGFEDIDYSTSGTGRAASRFAAKGMDLPRGSRIPLNLLKQKKNTLKAVSDTLAESVDAQKVKLETDRIIRTGKLTGDWEIASRAIDAERIRSAKMELALKKADVTPEIKDQWQAFGESLLPPKLRTPEQIDADIASLKLPEVEEQLIARFDREIDPNAHIVDSDGVTTTVRSKVEELDKQASELDAMIFCRVGGGA